jgi:UrcA family protein
MFRTFIATAILTLTITAAQAGPSAVVHFGDLDLSRPADVQVLNSRIEKAAEATCNVADPRTTSLYYQQWHTACMSHAVANTSARIAAVSGNKYRAFASK